MKVKNAEKRIWDVEGFDVRIMKDGRDARSDGPIDGAYKFERQAKNDMTVIGWKTGRFKQLSFPNLDVEVLDADGNPAHGATKLGTVRDSYNED